MAKKVQSAVGDLVLQTFFRHQLIMKMYHFQTALYGAHKASDSYLSGFLSQFDTFMEVYQGVFGRTQLSTVDVKAKTVTDATVVKYLNDFVDFLDEMEKLLGAGHTDLLNIRDEMKASANQLKYLLTFK